MASSPLARIRAVFLLFFSGAAALIYQTIWVKQLALVVGVDVYAVTTAVAAFFAGLACGSALLGRRADGVSRPLALYAILEVGIAICGVSATLALAHSASAFVTLQDFVGPLAWTLPFAAVGVPAFLMGGTLPALMRDLAPDDASVGRSSGERDPTPFLPLRFFPPWGRSVLGQPRRVVNIHSLDLEARLKWRNFAQKNTKVMAPSSASWPSR